MARPVFRSHLARFRMVLLAALFVLLAALVGLYLFGRAGKPRQRRAAGRGAEIEEGTKLIGKDFDYTFSQGRRPIFRIRGESIRMDQEETVYLDKVGLTLYDKEGHKFEAESEQASFNRQTNEGRLWGDVELRGPSELELYTPQLLLREKGNLVITPRPVRILYAGKYFARGDSLQAWLPDEIYQLLGNVRVETFPDVQPHASLSAARAVYERKRRQIRAEEDAELHRGQSELNADRISGLLSDNETALTFVRALYHVTGRTVAEAPAPPGGQAASPQAKAAGEGAPSAESGLRTARALAKAEARAAGAGSSVSAGRAAGGAGLPPAAESASREAAARAGAPAKPAAPGAGPAPGSTVGAASAGGPAGAGGASIREAGAGPTVVRFSGNDLAVLMEPAGKRPHQVNLEGTPAKRAMLESSGGGIVRTLTAPRLEGVLINNVLSSADAFEGVDIHEVGPPRQPGGAPGAGRSQGAAPPAASGAAKPRQATPLGPPRPTIRDAHGRRAKAAFHPDGQLATVALIEQVKYGDGEITATGDRANMDLDAGRGEFFGQPVDVASPRGELKAPHVIYTSADQLVHAVEGVRATLEQSADSSLAGTPLGEGKGPIYVQAQEAFWHRLPSSFVFRGDVRAWRGDNLLITPELRGERQEPGGDVLRAVSGVKTVWVPGGPAAAGQAGSIGSGRSPSGQPGAKGAATARGAATAQGAQGAPGAPGAGAKQQGPITVLATDMLYRDGSSLLTYSGNVHVDQEGKTLTCQQLDVELDKEHRAKTMTCTGQTRLNDPATGRSILGRKAVYRLETRKVDVFGEPATMQDHDGSVVRGKRMVYSVDDGKVEVLGKDEPQDKPAAGASGGAR
ncbi:MAG TPA: LPS export ABC transporter periplasmic protein LptC [Thermoanaerobaculia bacterium]|nr:LPS export ABC transporter periplasmic protein LptC [Thermoanaerobaculia bacterium]